MVSEDSDHVMPGFLAIHRPSELRYLDEAVNRLVEAGRDQIEAVRELLEVFLLRCPQRMLSKKRDDDPEKLDAPPNYVTIEMLAVVVVPLVGEHLPNSEEVSELV